MAPLAPAPHELDFCQFTSYIANMKRLSYKTTLDKFGRVLIPKKIRVNLGLTPGCDLKIEEHDTEITLYPVTEESILVNKEGVIIAKCDAIKQIEGFEKKVRLQRLKKLSGIAE